MNPPAGKIIKLNQVGGHPAADTIFPYLSLTDTLVFFELAAREFSPSRRRQLNFSIILIDFDTFKTVNDTKGNPYGDQALKDAAGMLKICSRSGDILGRYGGAEFIVLAYETDIDEADALSQRYCQAVPSALAQFKDMNVAVTLSIGIATYSDTEEITLETLLDRADTALYRSKEAGRNQMTIWQENRFSADPPA